MLKAANGNVEQSTDKTIIIPDHGPVGNKAQLIEYRDRLAEGKTKIETMKKQGQTLEEGVPGKPTKTYDARWTTFVINGGFFTNLLYPECVRSVY